MRVLVFAPRNLIDLFPPIFDKFCIFFVKIVYRFLRYPLRSHFWNPPL